MRTLLSATYYVSEFGGSDAYDGLAQVWDGTHGPWQTLTKVNNIDLAPGDSVLFERGGEYRSNIGLDRQDGDASGRITFGAYGEVDDPKPRILSSVEKNLYNVSWNGSVWYDWTETSPGSNIWTTQPLLDSVLPTGSELVSNGNFSQGATGWNLFQQGANATGFTTGGYYNLRMRSSVQGGQQGTDWSSIQLYTGVDLIEGEYYLLSFSAKATQPFTIPMIFIPDDAHVIAGAMPTLTTSWDDYQLLFKADATTREWLKFCVGGPDGLPLGADFSLDNVSFKRCTTPGSQRLIDMDVGNIIFNNGGSVPGGGSWSGMRRWNSLAELVQPGDYYADYATNTVQLYCTQNPATYYDDIEIALGGGDGLNASPVVAPGNYTNYENLDIRYGGADGIRTYYGNTSNFTVRNCDVAYIGGVGGGGIYGRIGNGFDLYGYGSHILVEGCRFWEIYDVALSIEALSGTASDVVFRNNVAWNCNWGMLINGDGVAEVADVYCVNNTFAYMGYQEMANQRPQQSGSNAAGFFFWNDGGKAITSTHIYNNIVYESMMACFYDGTGFDLNPIALDYNLYYQSGLNAEVASQAGNGRPHSGYHYMMSGYLPNNNKILFYPNWYNDTGKDQHTIVADPQFVDPANHDFRLRSTSPAINSGKTLNVPTDFDGIARPQGTALDIGAFEWQLPPAAALYGDYNRNDLVDAADYVIWRKTLNQTVPPYSGADGNGDSVINPPDHAVWREHFGQTVPTSTAAGSGHATSEPPQPVFVTAEHVDQVSLVSNTESNLGGAVDGMSEDGAQRAIIFPVPAAPTAHGPFGHETARAATDLLTMRKADAFASLPEAQSHAAEWSCDFSQRLLWENEDDRLTEDEIGRVFDTVFAKLGSLETH